MAVTYKYYYFACSLRLPVSPVTPHIPENGNEIYSRIAGETARETLMFRFSKPETPRAALFVFLRNETYAKSGFVSYVSISLCFDFDPSSVPTQARAHQKDTAKSTKVAETLPCILTRTPGGAADRRTTDSGQWLGCQCTRQGCSSLSFVLTRLKDIWDIGTPRF